MLKLPVSEKMLEERPDRENLASTGAMREGKRERNTTKMAAVRNAWKFDMVARWSPSLLVRWGIKNLTFLIHLRHISSVMLRGLTRGERAGFEEPTQTVRSRWDMLTVTRARYTYRMCQTTIKPDSRTCQTTWDTWPMALMSDLSENTDILSARLPL